jgi:hypothetical protein
MSDTNTNAELARCEHHIADLTLRIANLKEASGGTGLVASTALMTMLQETLQMWETHSRILSNAKLNRNGTDTIKK